MQEKRKKRQRTKRKGSSHKKTVRTDPAVDSEAPKASIPSKNKRGRRGRRARRRNQNLNAPPATSPVAVHHSEAVVRPNTPDTPSERDPSPASSYDSEEISEREPSPTPDAEEGTFLRHPSPEANLWYTVHSFNATASDEERYPSPQPNVSPQFRFKCPVTHYVSEAA